MPVRALLIALALLLSGCATNAVTGRSQFVVISEKSAIAQSAQAYSQMVGQLDKKGKIKDDPALQARIDDITGRLVAQAIRYRPETSDWAWSVKIIDEPETVNAFCMAGGKMAVYTGLIEKVEPTDDELAQVMGHEIGHALANHSAEKMSVAMMAQLGVAVFAALGSNPQDRATRSQAGVLAAAAIVTLPNSRAAETEADHIGIELAARAGYHPDAAASLWRKMMAATGNKSRMDFLSTHPAAPKRIEDLQARAALVMPFYESPEPRPRFDLASHRVGQEEPRYISNSDPPPSSLAAPAAAAVPLMLHTPEYDRFTKGEVTLSCKDACALGFALKRGDFKALYDGSQWRQLVQKVVSADYLMDLTYYYLGQAADALGYPDSAQRYYERSVAASADEATRCKGAYADWCGGLAFPAAAQARLAQPPAADDVAQHTDP